MHEKVGGCRSPSAIPSLRHCSPSSRWRHSVATAAAVEAAVAAAAFGHQTPMLASPRRPATARSKEANADQESINQIDRFIWYRYISKPNRDPNDWSHLWSQCNLISFPFALSQVEPNTIFILHISSIYFKKDNQNYIIYLFRAEIHLRLALCT